MKTQNTKWGSGDPHQYLTDDYFAAYDDHRYLKYDPTVGSTPAAYLQASCHDDRGGNSPTVVGEFSLSVATDLEWTDPDFAPPDDHVEWYRQWFAAQIQAYERQDGWFFWSWKANYIAGRNDWRWSYQGELRYFWVWCYEGIKLMEWTAAVAAGAIPTNINDAVNSNPCAGV